MDDALYIDVNIGFPKSKLIFWLDKFLLDLLFLIKLSRLEIELIEWVMTFFDNLALVFIDPTTLLSDVDQKLMNLMRRTRRTTVVNIWKAQLRNIQ